MKSLFHLFSLPFGNKTNVSDKCQNNIYNRQIWRELFSIDRFFKIEFITRKEALYLTAINIRTATVT